MNASQRRGYTLIELIVTVLIIGILTSIAVPQYLKTVETGKADDAAATVNMIGTTNKMFALDHANSYVTGTFTAPCGVGALTACAAAPSGNPCDLVWCKYLADQDWGNKPYTYQALDGKATGNTASAARVVGGMYGTASGSTYSNWGYTAATTGVINTNSVSTPPATY